MKYLKAMPLILCLFFSSIGAVAYSEQAKEEGIAFSIPANSFCDRSHQIQLSINITNLSASDAAVNLSLYDRFGVPITIADEEYNGIKSDIELGVNKYVPSVNTVFYQVNFGGNNNSCDHVPYYGVIKGNSGANGQFIASGWITATNGNTPIIINSGNPFTVVGNGTIKPEPTPEPVPDTTPVPLPSKEVCTNPNSSIVLSASSSYAADFVPCQAFDGDIYTSWATKVNVTTGWLKVDFSEMFRVNEYTITARTKSIDGIGYTPKDWTIEASNDDQNWEVLDTQTNQTNWSYGESRTYTFNNDNKYRYYRLNITQNNGVPYYTAIGEIRFSNNIIVKEK
ncbi:discoidin domain-containing protein [Paenibacillus sp. BT-177]|uniref:discoidin domain-containing protein n=1 Tax=Paenibacillus sp. BT-177 TaxID=2986930 RepID=UPI0021F73184|nr:discoidin domain-containing protein [Paenibacillus sp. BT-177]